MVQKGTADGLKTGHTEAGGYGLVVSSKRNGRRVILVLNGMTSMHERAEEVRAADGLGFFNFEDVTLFTAGDVVDRVPVWLGTERTVPLVAGQDVIVTMPRNWRQKASVKVSYDSPLTAPVVKGDTVGKLTVTGDGVPHLRLPLLAADGCAPAWAARPRDGGAVEIRDRHVSTLRPFHYAGRRGRGRQDDAVRSAGAARCGREALTVLRTREPGGAPGAELLRGILLGGDDRLVAPGGDAAALRRAGGTCGEDDRSRRWRRVPGWSATGSMTRPWRIRAMARVPTAASSPNRSGCWVLFPM